MFPPRPLLHLPLAHTNYSLKACNRVKLVLTSPLRSTSLASSLLPASHPCRPQVSVPLQASRRLLRAGGQACRSLACPSLLQACSRTRHLPRFSRQDRPPAHWRRRRRLRLARLNRRSGRRRPDGGRYDPQQERWVCKSRARECSFIPAQAEKEVALKGGDVFDKC